MTDTYFILRYDVRNSSQTLSACFTISTLLQKLFCVWGAPSNLVGLSNTYFGSCSRSLNLIHYFHHISLNTYNIGEHFAENVYHDHVCVITDFPLFHEVNFSTFSLYWYIFVNCRWVDTRWQQYSAHLHTNSTQNNTINNLVGGFFWDSSPERSN